MSHESTALATVNPNDRAVSVEFSSDQMKLIRDIFAKNATEEEVKLFVEVCKSTGLSPFHKQIYFVVRGKGEYRTTTIQTGIDGYRLIGERTGEFQGMVGPFWCGQDEVWKEVWIDDEPPAAAKVGIWRKGFIEPVWGIARYKTYVQTKDEYSGNQKTGKKVPNEFWQKMPDNQLAKVAEAQAWRKAFPAELRGMYTEEESAAAPSERNAEPVRQSPRRRSEQVAAPRERPANVDDDGVIDGDYTVTTPGDYAVEPTAPAPRQDPRESPPKRAAAAKAKSPSQQPAMIDEEPEKPAAPQWWTDLTSEMHDKGVRAGVVATYIGKQFSGTNCAAFMAEHNMDWKLLLKNAVDQSANQESR